MASCFILSLTWWRRGWRQVDKMVWLRCWMCCWCTTSWRWRGVQVICRCRILCVVQSLSEHLMFGKSLEFVTLWNWNRRSLVILRCVDSLFTDKCINVRPRLRGGVLAMLLRSVYINRSSRMNCCKLWAWLGGVSTERNSRVFFQN